MQVKLSVQHRTNWQDGILRWERRDKFTRFIQDALASLDIRYAMPTLPVQLIRKEGYDNEEFK